MKKPARRKVVAFSGGVGGAKLALGLSQVVAADDLTVIVNTGDDFEHLGFSISPDIDTVLYTLSGLADQKNGWGRHDETWSFMRALGQLGGETWFQLGDADLALHVQRTQALAQGKSLTEVITDLRKTLGIGPTVLPMTNDRVRTRVGTDRGWLAFQDYFVRYHCEPAVQEIHFEGAGSARLSDEVRAALLDDELGAMVICPSNPWLSVGPMLAIPELADILKSRKIPVVAVSPIIGGKAVKGPTAKLMQELCIEVSTSQIGRYYDGLIDALLVDHCDADAALPPSVKSVADAIMMNTLDDRIRLANRVLNVARNYSGAPI